MKRSYVVEVPARAKTLRAKTLRAKTLRATTIRRLVLCAAALSLALPLLAPPLRAQDMPAPPDDAAANSECATEPLTGSGPGFSSSRDASEDAAVAAWLEKAKTVYPDASWDTAKDAGVSCAVQGLYSKCFAQGIPCRPKSDDAAAAVAPESEAPKSE